MRPVSWISRTTTRRSALAALAVAGVLPATASAAARPWLTLTPSVVHRGDPVLIRGAAPGCPAGDTVTVISRAFARAHEFAGVPAVLTKVRAGGGFRVTTRIPPRKSPGSYLVTARCGGGNLGVGPRLTVRR